VVELTGDHFNDYGQEAMLYTLNLYKENDLPYYGGGINLEEGRRALTFEHNGNRIAFIGCNAKRGYATASETLAGAVQCDYDWLWGEVARLAGDGWLVIVTFQHVEVYTFIPQPILIDDFVPMAEAGAAIVSGSQAHQSHGVEFFDDDSLIMYGLGNLFFDQRGVVEYGDRALIARHVFYDGRYISTELLTIQFVDYAKPRYMTLEERRDFLTLIFDASRW
jgi:poly-gamma-glutamate synthesis protein (capsule biosynthesis protein)